MEFWSKKDQIENYEHFLLEDEIEESKLTPAILVEMIKMIDDGKITGKIAKTLVKDMLDGKHPSKLVKTKKVMRISDKTTLKGIIDEVFMEQEKAVQDVKDGTNPRSFEFLVGQVMKKTRGQADPEVTRELITEKLEQDA
jgi:aspartyl-tRNA(Asn)/glutamyl-tRNA(Gln) amidotransferase subunit B